MPRQLTFKIGKKEFTTSPVKVDRRKLYGWTELTAVDDQGNPCQLLTADESGKFIIPLGGTGIGILSETGKWVERSELKTVDSNGEPAKLFESSFENMNVLKEKVSPEEFLDYSITDFYELTEAPADMVNTIGDDIFFFEYSYNNSYDPSPAFIMVSDKTLFLLVAIKNVFEYLCFGDCETIDEDHDDQLIEEDDNIDFSMF